MTEPRFTCPQCPTVCGECEAAHEFTLQGVLEHWRWHTHQDMPLVDVLDKHRMVMGGGPMDVPDHCSASDWQADTLIVVESDRQYRDHVAGLARMSPAFTLTLIATLELLDQRHRNDGYGKCGYCGDETFPCPQSDSDTALVVAVVVAAGFEQVTP